MSTHPALQLVECVDDDATELTATDIASSVSLAREVGEDDETVATAPLQERPSRRPRPAMVAVVPDVPRVPDPAELCPTLPSADRPTPDLELLVLQQDNVRLLRENEAHQRRLDELRIALEGARRASREADRQAEHWKQEAARTEEALAEVAKARDHYRSFAESGLWERIRGCTPLAVEPIEADLAD